MHSSSYYFSIRAISKKKRSNKNEKKQTKIEREKRDPKKK